jgi:hypothetical protein
MSERKLMSQPDDDMRIRNAVRLQLGTLRKSLESELTWIDKDTFGSPTSPFKRFTHTHAGNVESVAAEYLNGILAKIDTINRHVDLLARLEAEANAKDSTSTLTKSAVSDVR